MMLKRKTHFLNIAFNHIDQIAKIRTLDNHSLDHAAKKHQNHRTYRLHHDSKKQCAREVGLQCKLSAKGCKTNYQQPQKHVN